MQAGRWHSRGRPVVYCASVEALAVLEVRVHLGSDLPRVPYLMHTVELPDDDLAVVPPKSLPRDWNAMTLRAGTQAIGDEWLASGRSLALRVPSVHSRTDYNVLLSPGHSGAGRVRIVGRYRYAFDRRMFQSLQPDPQ
jgi:RES domain-containing protein